MSTIEQQIEGVVSSILEDYGCGRDIDKMDVRCHPDKAVIIDMIEKLMRIIYPGAFPERNFRMYTVRHNLSMLIEDVMYNLNKQITLAFLGTMERPEAKEKAQELSLAFFQAIPAVRSVIQTDVEAFFDGDPAAYSVDEIIYCYPGLFAVTVYRLAHVLYELKVPMLPRIMTEHAHSVTGIDINPGATIGRYFFIDHGTGIDINPGATIGRYFFIDHGTGIVIGETTVIGEHVKLYQGVTLGALTTRGGQKLRGKRRHPTIEDNVTIYAGASILGGDTCIGHDSVIGSNVFITHSIPAWTTVSVKSQELNFKPRNCDGNCSTCTKTEPFWEDQNKV